MATTQTFETIVTLNAQQAKDEMAALKKTLDDLRQKKAEALKDSGTSVNDIKQINKEIRKAEDHVNAYRSKVSDTINTLQNLSTASIGEIEKVSRVLKQQMKSATNPEDYKRLEEHLERCKARINELKQPISATLSQYNTAIAEATRRAENFDQENALIDRTLKNISGSTALELETSLKLVNEQLANTHRGTEEYRELTEKAKSLKKEIAAVGAEQDLTKSKWSKFVNIFNTNWGAITQGLAAITGLSATVRDCTNKYAAMNQEMFNVTKYTGQAIGEVEEMNESFKKMNTRTARGELNRLAQDAGRLGITNREMVEEFVDGGDKINVALGDDLGDDAVEKIGKLAQMFGEDKTKGLRGAMLATGSAVNDLAQSSSANAGYIVDFTADLSGVARQAGMTQAQIMGLASALDQNMQDEATSSTVFSQLITKMFQEPMKFAKLAGVEVSTFTTMLKTDANGALLEFLQAMSNRGGFDQLAPMFSQMGLEGTRAVGVLSSVASNLDQVREAQATATQSYKDGTSVLNEFNVQNNTVQAGLDKAKKQFDDMCIELGEKLMPIAKYSVSLTSIGIKTLYVLIEYVSKHIVVLAALATTMLFYNNVLTVTMIKEKAWSAAQKVGNAIKVATVATTKLLNAALTALQLTYTRLRYGADAYRLAMEKAKLASITNPWAALATVLTVVGVAVYSAVKAWQAHKKAVHDNLQSVKEANAIKKQQEAINKRVAESYIDEKTRVQQLTKIIRSNAFSIRERRSAIAELQKIIPEYHATIKNEGKLYEENANAIDDYLKKLDQAAMAEAIYEQKKEIAKKRLELKQTERRKVNNIKHVNAEIASHPEAYRSYGTYVYAHGSNGEALEKDGNWRLQKKLDERAVHEKALKAAQSGLRILDAEDRELAKLINSDDGLRKAFADLTINGGGNGSGNGGNGGNGGGNGGNGGNGGGNSNTTKTDPKKEKYDKESSALKHTLDTDELALKQQLERKEIDEDEYAKRMYEKKQQYYVKLVDLQTKYDQDTTQTQQSMVDAAIAESKRLADVQERQMTESLDAKTRAYNAEQMTLLKQRTQGLLTEEKYNEKLKEAEIQYHRDRLAIIQEHGGDEYDEQKWLLDNELESVRQNEEDKKKAQMEVLEAQYDNANSASGQMAAVQAMYEQQLITYEQYQERMTEIARNKEEARRAIMQQAFSTVNTMLSAASSYAQACSDLETARINANYEKQIEAAGNNSEKKKRLEEKRDKELAAAKKKANKRAMVIQIAQATAQTAQSAINAYSSAAAIPIVGHILAPIAAATAVAAGMLQIATIKKQQQAQEAGYYEGGFTGGSSYRRKAGIVHEGEFVANHNAVNNPQVLPALQLIDEAQRNNTVGSLTAADISRSLGQGGATVVSAPSVTVNTDNSELNATLSEARDVIDQLSLVLAQGIHAKCYIDGDDGIAKNLDHYKKLNSRT
ncbi:phage tail tape measure protein [Leyella stercorea]|uniref:phage tail tape measure protein n=1 Tax=Leyella stercorea TaxID=363265 RepID=UPI00266FA602|nr:phage tail tape measure protein [Leyella stercorea]